MADTRCPHCDHVFAPDEITDEWCAQCGKHIPEMLLKDARPKPHLRNPHPHPLPPPSKETQAEMAHETKVRLAGMILMLVSVIGGVAALAWGTLNRMSGEGIGTAWWIGGAAAVLFLVGLVTFNRGETPEE